MKQTNAHRPGCLRIHSRLECGSDRPQDLVLIHQGIQPHGCTKQVLDIF